MNDEDRDRFAESIHWFNGLFDGVYQFFNFVVQSMPVGFLEDGFAPTANSYYYQRPSFAPAIPEYYALLLPLKTAALQVVAVFDERLFVTRSWLDPEPSIIVVLHDQPEKYGYLNDYALRVIANRGMDIEGSDEHGFTTGSFTVQSPVRFSASQISFDRLSDSQSVRDAVQQDIVGLVERTLPGQRVSQ